MTEDHTIICDKIKQRHCGNDFINKKTFFFTIYFIHCVFLPVAAVLIVHLFYCVNVLPTLPPTVCFRRQHDAANDRGEGSLQAAGGDLTGRRDAVHKNLHHSPHHPHHIHRGAGV